MTKRIYIIFGIILGIIVIFFGLLSKKDLNDNSIIVNDSSLKFFT
jgi:hypothetical protein